MMTLAYLLAVIVITVALVVGHLAFWTWYYQRPRPPDERHFVRTDDGWTLALARLRPRAAGPAQGEPVVCFPGFACNGRLFDFDDTHSLAGHLANLGFDVWMIDPRGTGHSERPGLFGKGWGFGFQDYAHRDAPAALRHVVRLGRLSTAIAPLAGWWRGWPETLFTHARNTKARSLRHFLVEVVDDVPRQLMDEFADQVVRGTGFDGRPAHLTHQAMAAARVPVLALAGDHDRIAPPSSATAAAAQVACDDATGTVVGSEVVHFGHLDLVVGDAAPTDIYPRIADWLLARRSACSMASAEAPAARAAARAPSTPG